ncbi:MAG TPA: amino acid adenylation domain-containing protein [Actinophytocola sp.]|nr:amino acid adenylation domain-containing protein [Actinophytocola sp.]
MRLPSLRGGSVLVENGVCQIPLSAAQRGIWFAHSLDPTGSVNSIADRIDIHGSVDPEIMRVACERVERDAEALRLRLLDTPDGPRQQVRGAPVAALRQVDLVGEPDPAAAADEWIAAETARPVELTGPQLCTAALLRLAEDHFVLYRRVHHSVVDGWSLALVHNRTAAVYTALSQGRPVEDAPFLAVSVLRDAETSYRESRAFRRDAAYWLDRLDDRPEPARLARRRTPTAGGVQRRRMPVNAGDAARLRAAADRLGLSWAELAIATTGAYVGRMTGVEDVVLGMPMSARVGRAERDTPGMTTNAVLVRLAVAPGTTVAELAAHTRSVVREAVLHGRYRSEDLARDLGLPATGRPLWGPVVNVMDFAYDLRFGTAPASLATVSRASTDDWSLTFFRTAGDSGFEIILDANPGSYRPEDADAHLARFRHFLDALAEADPRTPLDRVPLIGPTERQRVLAWGTGPVREIPPVSMHGMVEGWADRTPDGPAVEFAGTTLTYAELDARADGLARHLLARGAGPGRVVALVLTRSADLVVSVLGALKTGAAFVVVDPNYPLSRVEFTVADAAPVLLLAHAATADLTSGLPVERVLVDTLDPTESRERVTDAERGGPSTPDSPAYLIYTSGSTGQPKGVLVRHRGIVNVTLGIADRLGLGPGTRTLQFAALGFDAFIGELTQSVLTGGTLVLAPSERLMPGPELARLVTEQAINDLVLPPSALEVMAPKDLPAQATISIVGEASSPTVVRRWAPGRRLINGYGPSETTISTTMSAPLSAEQAEDPPIGTPLRNVAAYLLDEHLEPVPVGAVGELYIGGAGVSLGYLGREELTTRRFPPDPFAGGDARMYRTGDLARWSHDGRLHFAGRNDDQVKLRGFRVELGEVEAALVALPGVAAAAAAVREDEPGDRQLVGYLVAEQDTVLDLAAVRPALAERLPAFMTPGLLTVVDELPRNANGKLDRAALPEPKVQVVPHTRVRGTAREEVLAGLFAEVLGVPQVGFDDSFFDLGGHSLSATRLLGRIRVVLGRTLTVQDLFGAPTVAGLAHRLTEEVAADPEAHRVLVPLRAAGERPPLFCVHPRSGQSWIYLRLARYLPAGTPLYGIQARSLRETEDLPGSVAEMVEQYLRDVRSVQPHGPYHLLGWSMGGHVAYAMATRLRAAGEEVGSLVLLDAFPPDEADPPRPMDGPESLRALVELFDCPPLDPAAGPPTVTSATARLHAQGGDLAHLTQAEVVAMARSIRHSSALITTFTPEPYDGPLLLIAATEGRAADGPSVGDWRPHARGPITAHEVACVHDDMMQPGPLREVAAIVAAALEPRPDPALTAI